MILLRNVPFEKQAQFLFDDICAYPDAPAFAEALVKQASGINDGLLAYQDLLRGLYSDLCGIEGAVAIKVRTLSSQDLKSVHSMLDVIYGPE